MILFTEANPNVIKALKDTEYYNALHTITGNRVAILSAMAFPGHWGYPNFPPGTIGMMVPVWKEPHANRELLSTFKLEDSSSFPVLVLFDFKDDEMRFCTHRISGTSDQAVFESLSAVLGPICSADKATYEAARKKFRWESAKAKLSKVVSVLGALRGASGV